MKILFTSVGRRVELIQTFRDAARRKGMALEICGGDMSLTAPAAAFCDRQFALPAIRSDAYVPTLLELCRQEGIDALIPTIDTDLLLLAQHKAAFAAVGTRVVVSDPDLITRCRDKRLTYGGFAKAGLCAPRPVDDIKDWQGDFPAFIKPRDGSSSVNAFRVQSRAELEDAARRVPDYIVQPFVEGTEYTVDVLCDWEGKPLLITPRVRSGVRAGEVIKTEICRDAVITEEVQRLVAAVRPVGPITVQLIRRASDGRNYYIEINPRFGGGAPLSAKAGADSAALLLDLLQGESVAPALDAARPGEIYSRYEQSTRFIPRDGAMRGIRGVIFDMDDTLYPEKSYVRSGYRAVAACLGEPAVEQELWEHFLNQRAAIDSVLTARGLMSRKAECVRAYRSHFPDIRLFDEMAALIADLKKQGIRVGLITDGRPEGQRNKIAALGLDALMDDVIVTDELGGIAFRKPNDIAFRMMQCKWGIPFEQLVYVGDNAAKDFLAPRCLGMYSIWFKNADSVHPVVETGVSVDAVATDVASVARLVRDAVSEKQ